MKYTVNHEEFSFAVIASVLTGRIYARPDELVSFTWHVSHRDDALQMFADRETRWIPWLIAQFPFLATIDTSSLTDANAQDWFDNLNSNYGRSKFNVVAVHPAN